MVVSDFYLNYISNTDIDDIDKDMFHTIFKNGEIFLQPTQIDALIQLIKNKKSILSFEMGLGKTAILMAYASLLLPKAIEENKLIIISVPSANLSGFKKLVKEQMYFADKIVVMNGVKKNVDNFIKRLDNGTVNLLICQHSCWVSSPSFNYAIFNRRDKVLATAYDEAIEKYSVGYQHFVSLSEYKADYVVMATASINGSVSSFKQNNDSILYPVYNLAKAIALASNMTYKSFLSTFTISKYEKNNITYTVLTDNLMNFFGDKMVNMSRQHIGIGSEFDNIEFIKAFATPEQCNMINSTSESYRRILYGELSSMSYIPQNIPALQQLIQLLFKLSPETNKIIYCNHIDSTIRLRNILSSLGYNVKVINGVETPSPEDKQRVADEYNNSKGCILITNITKGINLGSGYDIITFSIPADLPQFIARAIRGFKKGNISLYVIYYPTYEKDTLQACLKMIEMTDNMLDRGYDKLRLALRQEIAST